MLKTFQIIALLQGIFLILLLVKKRELFKKVSFFLFLGTIISVLLFIIGDDDNNLFVENVDWFLFDSTLFITFLFLFYRYLDVKTDKFNRLDLIFFLPNILYFFVESLELFYVEEVFIIEIVELLIQFTFLCYLFYIFFGEIKNKSKKWITFLIIPITVIMSLSHIREVVSLFGINTFRFLDNSHLASYLFLAVGFVFYMISFNFLNKEDNILPIAKKTRYKTSSLKPELIKGYTNEIINSMEKEKLFLDSKLSIHTLSNYLKIPRQYISEILNLHLGKSFQDFINEYRIKEFEKHLENVKYEHYTLLGIAKEVGFNSKSSFNYTFKKIKGLTPSEFKKQLSKKVTIST